MKSIHQITIKYLTCLVLNKRKLDNKQEPILSPPPSIVNRYQYNATSFYFIFFIEKESTHRKVGDKPHLAPREFLSMVGPTGSNSRQITRRWFFFSFSFLWVPHLKMDG
jgi:hypothetical protein